MKRDVNTLSFILKPNSLFYVHCTIFHEFSTRRLNWKNCWKSRFHPMKGTNKSSLVLLSKKSAICDKLVNASNLKLLHGLSLKTAKLKLSKLFQFYFQDLTVFFMLLQFTFVAYGRWNARRFVNWLSKYSLKSIGQLQLCAIKLTNWTFFGQELRDYIGKHYEDHHNLHRSFRTFPLSLSSILHCSVDGL